MKSLPQNDAHLTRDSSAAACQSDASVHVPSTQAAFTDSHHGGVPPLDADDLYLRLQPSCVSLSFTPTVV